MIWLSGAYGVGKSTLAEAMCAQLPGAAIFDAEEVGNAVRGSFPGSPTATFSRTILCGAAFAVSCCATFTAGTAGTCWCP